MRIVAPMPNATFSISSDCTWPKIEFRTDASGPHSWSWNVGWNNFKKAGSVTTQGNQWSTGAEFTNCGGQLTVRVSALQAMATTTIVIRGTNPSSADVARYLVTKANSAGLDKIINQESGCRQFNQRGEPLKSFDNGYGLCQLTNPAPNIEQVWNWKLHIDQALTVMASKRRAAILHLSVNSRSYTDSQLTYETVSLWNGGYYHEWDASQGVWIRRKDVLCDTATGNIGWDMTKPENRGKTAAELRQRDKGGFGAGRPKDASWGYFGLCYADHVLG